MCKSALWLQYMILWDFEGNILRIGRTFLSPGFTTFDLLFSLSCLIPILSQNHLHFLVIFTLVYSISSSTEAQTIFFPSSTQIYVYLLLCFRIIDFGKALDYVSVKYKLICFHASLLSADPPSMTNCSCYNYSSRLNYTANIYVDFRNVHLFLAGGYKWIFCPVQTYLQWDNVLNMTKLIFLTTP